MTKMIRLENADTSIHRIRVLVQERDNGEWVTRSELDMSHPTSMLTQTIWSGRRLVVEEVSE